MPSSPARAVRALSFHAGYACRNRGACCTSAWPIPIEADRLSRARAAMATGHLRWTGEDRGADAFVVTDAAPAETPALVAVADSACVFFDRNASGHCRIHTALGHDALPLACRQFPRVSVVDPRGVSVTLSHYCPTAAALVMDDDDQRAVAIVSDAPAFPHLAEFSGLDVREALPPLLRPDMLMDWDAWWDFEARAVDLLANSAGPAESALARLRAIVETVRVWSPGARPLADHVRDAFAPEVTSAANGAPPDREPRWRELHDAIPVEWRPTTWARRGAPPVGAMRRFLTAHAFANWTAHLGRGLRTWFRSLEAAWACCDAGLDVREADLLLRHLADPHALARVWSGAES